jgi:preprotein translocase subunit SecB
MAAKKKSKGAGGKKAGNGGSPVPPQAGGPSGALDLEIEPPSIEVDESMMPIVVLAQYLKDLSFESPNAPESLTTMSGQPDVNISVNVEAKKVGDDDYEVVLILTVTAEENKKTMFIVEVTYAGLFTLNDIPEEALQAIILIEAPRLLFPFARNIVSDATREGGFPPLLIQPVDFVSLYQQHMEAQDGEQEPA